MRASKTIITGGAGFIGSNLADHLIKIGHKVIILDNFVSGKKSNLSHHKKNDLKIVKIDVSKSKKLDKYFKGVDYIFHLAALAQIIPSIKNPKKYFSNNVLGTLNVVKAAKKASRSGPAPIRVNNKISRTMPKIRLTKVQKPTVKKPDITRMGFKILPVPLQA